MQAAVSAITGGKGALDVKIIQLVRLLRNGEPVKMSKRAGEFVTLRDVVDEVGCDAVRFMMLYRKNDALLDFDMVKVKEQSRDNPVFYVQYGHARGYSVFRNAREALPDLPQDAAARIAFLQGGRCWHRWFRRIRPGHEHVFIGGVRQRGRWQVVSRFACQRRGFGVWRRSGLKLICFRRHDLRRHVRLVCW